MFVSTDQRVIRDVSDVFAGPCVVVGVITYRLNLLWVFIVCSKATKIKNDTKNKLFPELTHVPLGHVLDVFGS